MRDAINILVEEMEHHLQQIYPELKPALTLDFKNMEYSPYGLGTSSNYRALYISVNLFMVGMKRSIPIFESRYQYDIYNTRFSNDSHTGYWKCLEYDMYKHLVRYCIDQSWIKEKIQEIADPLKVFLKDR